MAPGPKKKFSYRKGTEDKILDTKKSPLPHADSGLQQESGKHMNDDSESLNSSGQKYANRSIKSNWDRYNEPIDVPFADRKRGNDFEVLLSYSGGTDSQLKLQDEKEWNEACIGDKNITIDFPNLISAFKCLPFHNRLNLADDIFDENQISKFISSAQQNKACYLSKISQIKAQRDSPELTKFDTLNSSLNIVENLESENDHIDIENTVSDQYILESKTENLIESLASCLTMKDKGPDVVIAKDNPCSHSDVTKSSNTANDLDFLLSLNVSSKPDIIDKTNTDTKVDDWLNSILDD